MFVNLVAWWAGPHQQCSHKPHGKLLGLLAPVGLSAGFHLQEVAVFRGRSDQQFKLFASPAAEIVATRAYGRRENHQVEPDR
jgi:hypothetical protein